MDAKSQFYASLDQEKRVLKKQSAGRTINAKQVSRKIPRKLLKLPIAIKLSDIIEQDTLYKEAQSKLYKEQISYESRFGGIIFAKLISRTTSLNEVSKKIAENEEELLKCQKNTLDDIDLMAFKGLSNFQNSMENNEVTRKVDVFSELVFVEVPLKMFRAFRS